MERGCVLYSSPHHAKLSNSRYLRETENAEATVSPSDKANLPGVWLHIAIQNGCGNMFILRMAAEALTMANEEFGDGSTIADYKVKENLQVHLPRTPSVFQKHSLIELNPSNIETKKLKTSASASLLYSMLSGEEDSRTVRLRSRLCPREPAKPQHLMKAPLKSAPRQKSRRRIETLKETKNNCFSIARSPPQPPASQRLPEDPTAFIQWILTTFWDKMLTHPLPAQQTNTEEPLDLSRSSEKKSDNIFTSIQRLAANDSMPTRVRAGSCSSAPLDPGLIRRSNSYPFTKPVNPPTLFSLGHPITSQDINPFSVVSFNALATSAAYAKFVNDLKLTHPAPMLVKNNLNYTTPLLPFLPIMKG